MTHGARNAAAAWAVMLALALAACGSQTTAPDASSTAANITFKTDPVAEVWIDGENLGATPIVLAVAPGSHEVVFKAEGFKDEKGTIDVSAGKDLTVEAGLEIAGTSVEDYKRLLAALAIEHEDFGEIETHRGGNDAPVMLYWPKEDVRKSALTTYRLEVTPAYEDDGWIEFRKGREVLHREKFQAEDLVTEKALPVRVIEALKRGGNYSWGVYFESKRKKPIVAKFDVVDERKIDRRLEKLAKRSTFRRANPLMREMARIDVLRDSRLYSESLQASLSVLNTWPETEMPFKSIAFALERLKLRDTTLYSDVAGALRGNGPSPRRPGLQDTNRDNARGGQTSDLPPSMVAPRVRERTGGLKAGGLGVTPTPDAQKRQPGPIEPGSDEPTSGGAVQPGLPGAGDAARRDQLVADATKRLTNAEEAERAMNESAERRESAEAAAVGAREALDDAKAALEALQSSGTATQDELDAASQAVSEAQDAARAADEAADKAREAFEETRSQSQRILGRTGSPDEARQALEELRRSLEKDAASQPGQTDGARQAKALLAEAAKRADDAKQAESAMGESAQRREAAEAGALGAREALDGAKAALEALQDSGTATQDELDAASRAVSEAQDAARVADEAVDKARQEFEEVRRDAERVLKRTGSPEEAQQALEELRRSVEQAGASNLGSGQQQLPLDPRAVRARIDETNGLLLQARELADSAHAALQAALEAADAPHPALEGAIQTAEASLETLMGSGTATEAQIEAARAAVDQARADLNAAQAAIESTLRAAQAESARAEMEIERLRGELQRATRELQEAEALAPSDAAEPDKTERR